VTARTRCLDERVAEQHNDKRRQTGTGAVVEMLLVGVEQMPAVGTNHQHAVPAAAAAAPWLHGGPVTRSLACPTCLHVPLGAL